MAMGRKMTRAARWRRKSPAALALVFLLVLAQAQSALAAIVNTVVATGSFNGQPVTAQATESVDVADAAAAMAVTKSGILNDDDGSPGLTAGDSITFTITIKNTGNLTLTGVKPDDPMFKPAYVDGDAAPTDKLDPGETWNYTGTYFISAEDIAGNGGGDGDIDNTVTVISDQLEPQQASTAVVLEGLTGDATISGTVFHDINGNNVFDAGDTRAGGGYRVELVDGNGVVVAFATTDANGDYTLTAPPGSDYKLVFRDAGGKVVGGIADVDLLAGEILADQSLPVDPSGVVYDSSTRQPVAGAIVRITDAAGAPLLAACLIDASQQNQVTGADGAYRFDVIPGADLAACPVGETEYRLEVSGPAGYQPGLSAVLSPQTGALDATDCPIDAIPGGHCQVSGSVAAPTTANVLYFIAFIIQAGDLNVVNNHLPIDSTPANSSGNLTKTALREDIRRGETVPYVIAAKAVAFDPAQIVDMMPPGFAYVPGSATVNGAAQEPVVDGRFLTFDGLIPDATGAITLRLTLLASAAVNPGVYVNKAVLVDPATGDPAGEAQDSVRVVTEPVFECSDIIGRVFDDKNRSGYPDAGEGGLPGVRMATVRGVLVTTDRLGRFSVPCAEIPDADIGSNFIMKLDTRTLPEGYSLTTENPRDVRVTRGKAAKLNFGAAVSRVVRLDLRDEAFKPGGVALREAWSSGIAKLVGVLEQEPSILRITYHLGGDAMKLVKLRISHVERLVREEWKRRPDGYRLPIETRVMDKQ